MDYTHLGHLNIHSQSEKIRRHYWFLFLYLNGSKVYIMELKCNLHKQISKLQPGLALNLESFNKLCYTRAIIKI